ncbi:MAG: hydrogenase maturation nickel metallochaperone HypA [Rhodospirillales bacterium]|nr:hydrogenase maturation nickel metallochaperone HypA [Rhodospirillales bacterium]MBT4039826.1 hydrogenase maturation nickel metallochaperone HypA [Rhodospirillales bacterium]MBT4625972.1 hydrogenase maturation nickel metallochaperone HypA [Rhodospirillales bacterium]MBT5350586.1 hydrogenase maturation nickel metallochaperone HypA [Rhodospirillales bacterium]MBT5520314.1 hydrogenase maturation nickel metallochaperone HypA [Rhodospirillales bacterium]
MHEIALARSLTEMVDDYALQQGVTRIKQINIRLGEMSAMTRALHFCFGSAAQGTSCEGAVLNIEEIPLTVFCESCDTVKTPNGRYNFRCPDCGLPTPNVVTGREMQLTSIELYETADAISAARSVEHTSTPVNSAIN